MSFKVTLSVQREFDTAAPAALVFGLLSDVPRSASFFPDVERLDDLGANKFRWTMEKIGLGDYTLQQTIYECAYRSDSESMRVDWTAVEGVGNALVSGGWRIESTSGGTKVSLNTKGILTVDLPGFLQFLLSPVVEMAFTQKIDRYLSNLREQFDKI
jgi:hypothetical protein